MSQQPPEPLPAEPVRTEPQGTVPALEPETLPEHPLRAMDATALCAKEIG